MICDLAQTYHLFNYKEFPMPYIAKLVCGLPSNSRVAKKISNIGYSTEEIATAKIVDLLSLIWWSKTKDGQNNRNRPQLITEKIFDNKKHSSLVSFDSPESYENERQRIIKEKRNGKRN